MLAGRGFNRRFTGSSTACDMRLLEQLVGMEKNVAERRLKSTSLVVILNQESAFKTPEQNWSNRGCAKTRRFG
jgi:hypothetical protein